MQGKMKAALKVEAAPGAKIALVDIPHIGSRDVLVQVKAASICGTDMHIYEWDAWAQSRLAIPRVFGHEFAGEVVEVGCGPIGLWAVGLCRVSGSSTIFAVEPNHQRLEIATKMGANYVLNPGEVDPVQQILAITDGLGVDVSLEMSGNAQAIRQSFKSLRNGGRVSLLGLPSRTVELDLANDIIFKGATVFGISGRRIFDTWYRTRRILEDGLLDLMLVITHTLSFAQIHEAMEIMKTGDCGKIVMKM